MVTDRVNIMTESDSMARDAADVLNGTIARRIALLRKGHAVVLAGPQRDARVD